MQYTEINAEGREVGRLEKVRGLKKKTEVTRREKLRKEEEGREKLTAVIARSPQRQRQIQGEANTSLTVSVLPDLSSRFRESLKCPSSPRPIPVPSSTF